MSKAEEGAFKRIRELREEKRTPSTLIELGALYERVGKRDYAHNVYVLLAKDFEHPLGHIKLGDGALRQGKYRNANMHYTQALNQDPNSLDAYLGLIQTHLRLGNFETAKGYLRNAQKIDPEDFRTVRQNIIYLIKTHQIMGLQRILEQHPTGQTSHENELLQYYRGYWHLLRHEFQAAFACFEPLLTMAEQFSDAYPHRRTILLSNLAYLKTYSKSLDEALVLFKDILNGNQGDLKTFTRTQQAQFYYNYGVAFWLKENYEESLAQFKIAEKLAPESFHWSDGIQAYLESEGKNLAEKTATLRTDAKKSGLNFGLYLGCVIPNRYPMVELATRIVLDYLDVGIVNLEGASCCPAPGVFRSFNESTWLTLGARNINIAEKLERDLVTMCNGCYGTLSEVNHKLQGDKHKRQEINQTLAKAGLDYKGSANVHHVMEVLYKKIGPEQLKQLVINQLDWNVAVHYGCHMVKASENRPWGGEYESPRFFQEVLEITGCKTLEYKDAMMCCGAGGGVRSAGKEVSLDFTREKMENLRNVGAEALVVACPFCYLQYDLGQVEVNSVFKDQIGEPFNLPIIYITQVLGLAFGFDPCSLGVFKYQKKGTPPFQAVEPLVMNSFDLD